MKLNCAWLGRIVCLFALVISAHARASVPNCSRMVIDGIKASLAFSVCVGELRGDCPADGAVVDWGRILVGGSALSLWTLTQATVRVGEFHSARQKAMRHAGEHRAIVEMGLLRKRISEIPLPLSEARAAAQALRMEQEQQLLRATKMFKRANLVMAVGTLLLFADREVCSDTIAGQYTTQEVVGQGCRPKLALSPQVVRFLSLPVSDQDKHLRHPEICSFYSDLADELKKREETGANSLLRCGGKPELPNSYSAKIDGKDYEVAIHRASDGRLEKLVFKNHHGEKSEFLFAAQADGLMLTSVYDTNAFGARTVLSANRLKALLGSAAGAKPDSSSGRKLSLLRNWNSSRAAMEFCCKDASQPFCAPLRGDSEAARTAPLRGIQK